MKNKNSITYQDAFEKDVNDLSVIIQNERKIFFHIFVVEILYIDSGDIYLLLK